MASLRNYKVIKIVAKGPAVLKFHLFDMKMSNHSFNSNAVWDLSV